MGRNPGSRPSLPLSVAALATVVVAVAMDVLADEHPTHTLVVGLAAVAVAAARIRLAGRFDVILSSVSGALVAQPALHVAFAHTHAHPHTATDADGVTSSVASHGSTGMAQILLPMLAVLTVAFCSQIVELLIAASRRLRPKRRRPPRPVELVGVRKAVVARTSRIGSMLRWCGWALQTARRGPPPRTHLVF